MSNFVKVSVLVIVVIIMMVLAVVIVELTPTSAPASVFSSKGEEAELVGAPDECTPLVEYGPVSLPGVAFGALTSEPSPVRPVARMPPEYISERRVAVSDLAVGQGGWVSSVALYVAEKTREVWLSPSETVKAERGFLFDVFIGREVDGFCVDISNLPVEQRKWKETPEGEMPSGYLRVVKLIDGNK